MLILIGTRDILNVVLNFCSLIEINTIQKFFFTSLGSLKASRFGDLKLPISKLRKISPLKNADWSLKIHKVI
jgi:hypothetical protein